MVLLLALVPTTTISLNVVPSTMVTFTSEEPEKCGVVEVDEHNIVRGFHEKVDNPPGNQANAAIYAFDNRLFEKILTKSQYQKGYWSLTSTLFQGAFSDNLFKWILVYVLINALPESDTAARAQIPSIAGLIFAIPFIIFPGIFVVLVGPAGISMYRNMLSQ